MKQKLTLTENDYKIIIKVNAFVEKVLKGKESIEYKDIDIIDYDDFITTMFIFMYSPEEELVNYYLIRSEEEIMLSYIDEGKVCEVKTRNWTIVRKDSLCKKKEICFS